MFTINDTYTSDALIQGHKRGNFSSEWVLLKRRERVQLLSDRWFPLYTCDSNGAFKSTLLALISKFVMHLAKSGFATISNLEVLQDACVKMPSF